MSKLHDGNGGKILVASCKGDSKKQYRRTFRRRGKMVVRKAVAERDSN